MTVLGETTPRPLNRKDIEQPTEIERGRGIIAVLHGSGRSARAVDWAGEVAIDAESREARIQIERPDGHAASDREAIGKLIADRAAEAADVDAAGTANGKLAAAVICLAEKRRSLKDSLIEKPVVDRDRLMKISGERRLRRQRPGDREEI